MWWFYTVILGMSFGQILGELALTVRGWSRDRARRPFLPAVLWQVFLLVLVVEVWLAVTYYRTTLVRISVLELLAFLSVPAGILVMSFLLPAAQSDSPPDDETPAAAFDRVRPVFFGVLIGIVAINIAHESLISNQKLDADLIFQIVIAAGAVVGLLLRRPAADVVLALAMIAVLGVYIGTQYSTVLVEG